MYAYVSTATSSSITVLGSISQGLHVLRHYHRHTLTHRPPPLTHLLSPSVYPSLCPSLLCSVPPLPLPLPLQLLPEEANRLENAFISNPKKEKQRSALLNNEVSTLVRHSISKLSDIMQYCSGAKWQNCRFDLHANVRFSCVFWDSVWDTVYNSM